MLYKAAKEKKKIFRIKSQVSPLQTKKYNSADLSNQFCFRGARITKETLLKHW